MKHHEIRDSSSEIPQPIAAGDVPYYEDLLWAHASETAAVRVNLEEKVQEIYGDLRVQGSSQLNLHEQELRIQKEKEYWDLNERLQDISHHEEKLLGVLERLESGEATVQDVNAILPEQTEEEERQLSRKKQSIKRDRERLGVDPRAIASELLLLDIKFVSATDPRRISSGRNRRRLISGRGLDIFSAQGAFFDATADTHGGKVRHNGKKANVYVGKGGRVIRKK